MWMRKCKPNLSKLHLLDLDKYELELRRAKARGGILWPFPTPHKILFEVEWTLEERAIKDENDRAAEEIYHKVVRGE